MTKKKALMTRAHHLSEENLKQNQREMERERLKRAARSEENLGPGRLTFSREDLKDGGKGEKSNKIVKADKTKTPKSSKKKTRDETPQDTVDALASGGQNNLIPQGMVPLPYVSMVPPYHQAYGYPGASMNGQMVHPAMMGAQTYHPQMMAPHMAQPQMMMPQGMPQMTPGYGYMPVAYPQQAQFQNGYAPSMMYASNQGYTFVPVESPVRQTHLTEQEDIYENDESQGPEDESSQALTEEEPSSTGYEDSAFSD
ncbi:hypothetical protein N0V84_011880 [Fusarium piperis]|uniref:Uncharacterized protein n=1 Tax=Fusarium piperis TaxID=1435070 RepID=A0A9W8TCI4_9HYPO|nr:hypothetical protein N0V84_011880 [Fusarium piperis]